MITLTLAELAAELNGEVVGDGSLLIRGVAGIREATPGDITFIANSRYNSYLKETHAAAVIISRDVAEAPVPLLRVDNPYLAFQRAVRLFRPDVYRPGAGVHATAVVSPEATLGAGVSIGPHCVIERGARIGDRAVLMAGCYVGANGAVGSDSYLYPHVTVREECVLGERCIVHPGTVVGSDGFGFALDGGRYHKVPQVGTVIVGDDVEIGANVTIDRATTDATRIGNGTKIDNLVQIGHNVVVGEHCIIVAQVGISGSTRLEDYVTVAGQAGLAGHITVGRGAQIGGQTGVSKSVKPGSLVFGTPALPLVLFKRVHAYLQRLPELFRRTKSIEERLTALEQQRDGATEREGVR
jgi:UDP-3-O-[3-hydroxymyristoyl] glucosamine N-acyltransferase